LWLPRPGTVVAVNAVVGERVGTGPVVTLADLAQPTLKVWVEEQDMGGVSVGDRVDIYFEALPDVVLSGEITQIDPELVTVQRTLAVQAWASVDVSSSPERLIGGMSADVEIISAEARDAVLVPLQALRQLGPESYAVFVVSQSGEMELRPVVVGLQDFVNAEIVSGLDVGETVSLGEATPTEEVVVPENQFQGPGEGGPGGGGIRFFFGG